MKNAIVFFNPKSGKGYGTEQAKQFAALWHKTFSSESKLEPSYSLEHFRQIVEQIDLETSIPIFMGGDGTFSEGINVLFKRNNFGRLFQPVGLLPSGSGNSFLEDFGLSDFELAATNLIQAIEKKESLWIDAAKLVYYSTLSDAESKSQPNQRAVINIWGIGLVSQIAETAMKLRFLGRFNYTVGTLWRTLFRYRPEKNKIQLNNKQMDVHYDFITLSNSRFTGGKMLMAPQVRVNDGKLLLVHTEFNNRWKILAVFPKIFKGEHIKLKEVKSYFVEKEISFIDDHSSLMLVDGELIPGYRPELILLPQSWSLYMPFARKKIADIV